MKRALSRALGATQYTVQSGDTKGSIAAKFGTTLAIFEQAFPSNFMVGQTITIPDRWPAPAAPMTEPVQEYTAAPVSEPAPTPVAQPAAQAAPAGIPIWVVFLGLGVTAGVIWHRSRRSKGH